MKTQQVPNSPYLSARQLAGELRHSPVHRDASHDGSFSILVMALDPDKLHLMRLLRL